MFDTVLPITEQAIVGQDVRGLSLHPECLMVECRIFAGDVPESDTTDGAHLRAEILLEETLRKTNALEDLRTPI